MAECSTIPVQDNQQLLVKICHPWTWRIANVSMAVFFALAAYVQVSEWFVCKHKARNFIPIYRIMSIDPLNSHTYLTYKRLLHWSTRRVKEDDLCSLTYKNIL